MKKAAIRRRNTTTELCDTSRIDSSSPQMAVLFSVDFFEKIDYYVA